MEQLPTPDIFSVRFLRQMTSLKDIRLVRRARVRVCLSSKVILTYIWTWRSLEIRIGMKETTTGRMV